jgi:hypothetical protein
MEDMGHDACPVAEGQCCIECNERIVIPARLSMLAKEDNSTGPSMDGGQARSWEPLRLVSADLRLRSRRTCHARF